MSQAPQVPAHSHVQCLLVPLLHLSAWRVFIALQRAGTKHTPQIESLKAAKCSIPVGKEPSLAHNLGF